MEPTVLYEVRDHIAHVTLNRPAKKNAINGTMRKEVQAAFADVKHNRDVWLAILTGRGDTFCAGGRCVPRTCSGFAQGGTCSFQGSAAGLCCPQGFNATCMNPTNDTNNCGGCAINCGAGASCVSGRCSNAAPECALGHLGQFCKLDAGTSHVCCPGSAGCVDTLTDSANCGRCGGACANGLTCTTFCQGSPY